MSTALRLLAALAAAAGVVVATVAVLSGGTPDAPGAPSRSQLATASVGRPIRVGVNPIAVAVGAGAIWIIDASRQTLSKVDPTTRMVVGEPRRVAGGPFAVAVGEDAVWVAAGDGAVRAYDPRSIRPTGPTTKVPGANGLAVGSGGVWITSRRAGTVTRVDPRTRRADAPIRVGAGAADVAVGLGAVWVANADAASVSRIDPRTGRTRPPIAVGARQVLALALGEGGVWVARAGGPNADRVQLVRIDPATSKVAGDPIAIPGAVPLDLVAGNGLWVTDSGSAIPSTPANDGAVTRVDPAARTVAARSALRTGKRPSAIALGEGPIWVTNEDDGTLTPIAVAKRR